MSDRPTYEVRFAIVLYGGVSLAIYMNGISQELLRMVRGSSGDLGPDDLDDVEKIYCELSHEIRPGPGRARFVIDIISGTSAGGINGVALAKALAIGSPNLNVLRRAWTEEADIGLLLNDKGLPTLKLNRTESLLDGGHMYEMLDKTLSAMNAKASKKPLAPMLDLFVTATDLQGNPVPIQLTGGSIDEKVHKAVFHFVYDPDTGRNDFTETADQLLAFAARCTSSFPVAFPPVRFSDMPATLQSRAADFDQILGKKIADRVFADGGYLDNRPFGHAINLIPFRHASLPGERKLIFIDPFPEKPAADGAQASRAGDIDFLQNAKLAATTLPRREVIRDDIKALTAVNRRLERLDALQDRWRQDLAELAMLGMSVDRPAKPDNLEKLDLADLLALDYGRHYPLYHHLRVYGTTDRLSDFVTHIADYDPESDQFAYLRQIVRAWRAANFTTYKSHDDKTEADGAKTENELLATYDLDFRLRRLDSLRASVAKELNSLDDTDHELWSLWTVVGKELARLRALCKPAADARDQLVPKKDFEALASRLEPGFDEVMNKPTLAGRFCAAKIIYADRKAVIDKLMEGIGASFKAQFDASGAKIQAAFDRLKNAYPFQGDYEGFHWDDSITFPFLEGTTAEALSEVQVFRISPAESGLNNDPEKLAGISVGAFGGFLNRDWREHDILWGRLDGAEQIVNTLLPAERQAETRTAYIKRLHTAILKDEFHVSRGAERQMALLKARLSGADILDTQWDEIIKSALGVEDAPDLTRERFETYYTRVKPVGPPTTKIANWVSRSAAIFARMIDDLPTAGTLSVAGKRIAGPLRASSALTARLTHFALPGSYPRLFAMNLLLLAVLIGLVLIIVAAFTNLEAWVGYTVLVASAALWMLLYATGRVLRRQTPLSGYAVNLAVAVFVLLAIFGAITLFQLAARF